MSEQPRGDRRTRFASQPLNSVLGESAGAAVMEGEVYVGPGIHSEAWEGPLGCTDCASPCDVCTRRWVRVEYLSWWRRGQGVPPLATTAAAGTGVLGGAGTNVAFGGQRLGSDTIPGGRVELGFWFDDFQQNGLAARYYSLGGGELAFALNPAAAPVTARPFLNVTTSQQDARLVNFPGISTGTISISGDSEIWGGDIYLRRGLYRGAQSRVDFLGGYQFARVAESLQVGNSTTFIANSGTIAQGTVVVSQDVFRTENEFNGGLIGLQMEFQREAWSLQMLAKLGLGSMKQRVVISGQTVTTVPAGGSATTAAGLLAQASNSGTFESDAFAAVPELGLTWKYRFHPLASISVGYSVVYWSNVLRPGDQIDLAVNTNQAAGAVPLRPRVPMRNDDLWVHGLSLGIQCDF